MTAPAAADRRDTTDRGQDRAMTPRRTAAGPNRLAWSSFDPLKVIVTVALVGVVMVAVATLVYRDYVARLPEIGAARAWDAEADARYDPTIEPIPLVTSSPLTPPHAPETEDLPWPPFSPADATQAAGPLP